MNLKVFNLTFLCFELHYSIMANYSRTTASMLRPLFCNELDLKEFPPPFFKVIPHKVIFQFRSKHRSNINIWKTIHCFWTEDIAQYEKLCEEEPILKSYKVR